MPPKHYMDSKRFQASWKEIESNSLEDKIDSFWLKLLFHYFHHEEFDITQNSRPANNKKRADFIVRAITDIGKLNHVVLVEDKRPSLEGQSSAWHDAVEQLTGYVIQARDADKRKQRIPKDGHLPYPMYGIVNVGRYSRFYVLYQSEDTFQDLPGTHGKAFHLKNDSKEVEKFLLQIVALTLPYVSSSSSDGSSRPGSSSGAPKTTSKPAGAGSKSSTGAPAKSKS